MYVELYAFTYGNMQMHVIRCLVIIIANLYAKLYPYLFNDWSCDL